MANLTFKSFDTYPPLQATLADQNGPLNLSGATVKVVLKGQTLGGTITGNCTITEATEGIVVYAWEPGDTNVADTYEVEFMITWVDGGITKVPNAAAQNPTIEIDDALAGAAG